ncbi:MAG TPA: polymer-forming cytoskeletal protein [Terracidiphilus sp.]|nr:polymer-forming cytoskeletal protein [Terracidiphilus sp.]
MWKSRSSAVGGSEQDFTPEPVQPPVNPAPVEVAARPKPMPDQAMIGKGIVVKGDVTGSDPAYIDGRVEGTIQIPGERVTVGKDGTVVGRTGSGVPCITAREIVILGTVTGDIAAGDRVDIRAGGSLTGDVTTMRVSIEDGAFFRGGIDIRREDPKTMPAAARFEVAQPV